MSVSYPHCFAEVVGHAGPVRILSAALAGDRVPHAYLFAGPDGVGKQYVAERLVHALLCEHPGERPCGSCRSCARLAHDTAYNLIRVVPDGAQIKVDQVRGLGELMRTGADRGVVILGPVEAMRDEAANALLKTLEEPPKGWVMVLLSARLEGLLPTLRSRCQLVRFARLNDGQSQQVLSQQVLSQKGVEPEMLARAVALAQGAPGSILSLGLAGAELEENFQRVVGVLSPATLNSPSRLLAAAESMGRDAQECRRFLQWAQLWASDALHCAARGDTAHWAAALSVERLGAFILRLEAVTGLLERNVNRQSVIEDLLVMLQQALCDASQPGGIPS